MGVPAKLRRRPLRGGGAVALVLSLAFVAPARAAIPTLGATFSSAVSSSTARLNAEINPDGLSTSYHFDYLTKAAYEANLSEAKAPFTGAKRAPTVSDQSIGAGSLQLTVQQVVSQLTPLTSYRYRVVAKNSSGTVNGAAFTFTTRSTGGGSILADGRGWEMVSPLDKNGGQVDPPGAIAGGGVLQAAAQGGSFTWGSSASFAGGQGAPPASQYLSTRTGSGWSTENLTVPIFSGSFETQTEGVPYRLFSTDLSKGLLLNGDHCRGGSGTCAVANPPLGGAPAGWQNYYLREGGTFTPLVGAADVAFTAVGPARFDLRLAGASPDLSRAVLTTCAALTANATEVPDGEGCDPEEQNLYGWSKGSGLALINLLPAQSTGTPGAKLAAQAGAISADGTRIWFTQGGNLYLRASGQTKQADEDAGGGGSFEAASTDGAVAFFSKGGHLWRYLSSSDTATDITPSGEVKGVLGASTDGTHVYFQDAGGLKLWHSGTTTPVPGASAADPSNYPAATGTARVSADGTKLLFLSKAPLTEYDNIDLSTGQADSQLFLFDATGAGTLVCISCNPTGQRPIGPSTVPGAIANGTAEGSLQTYKPRVLSVNAKRVFFDSKDALALTDTNNDRDAYEWEAQGEGDCNQAAGCISLVSSGRATEGASFVDASADGSEAYFLTDGSLVGIDPGSTDLYVAKIGGGFAEPIPPIGCEGDNCQSLPPEPKDPTLTTLLSGPGNPAIRFAKRCKPGFVSRKGKCVKKGKKTAKKTKRNRRRRGR